jgi:hypothetical protein
VGPASEYWTYSAGVLVAWLCPLKDLRRQLAAGGEDLDTHDVVHRPDKNLRHWVIEARLPSSIL